MRVISYNAFNKEAVKVAAAYLRAGKAVAYPTDTSYGLGVDPMNARAIRKLYAVKGRPTKKPIHLAVSSRAMARRYAEWNVRADRLAKAFWPGPLTLILPLKRKAPASLKLLSIGKPTVRMRMPDHAFILALTRKLGRPVTTTSANPSGRHGGIDAYSGEEVVGQFSGRRRMPDLVVDAGRLPRRKPSTFVRLYDDGTWELIRKGPISVRAIENVLDASKRVWRE